MIEQLQIQTASFKINLSFKHIVSIATGYSSTGKTFLVSKIKELQAVDKSRILGSNIDIQEVFIIDNELARDIFIKKYEQYKNKFIIIDRFDYLCNDELKFLILSGQTQFLIMSHVQYELLNLNSESFITIDYDKCTKTFKSDELINHLSEEII